MYLFSWYRQLCKGDALTYRELSAWSEMTGTRPVPREVDILMQMDIVYHNAKQG